MENVQIDDTILGTKIKAVPEPQPDIGIDVNGVFTNNIVSSAINSSLDISALESFTTLSQNRENIYQLIDAMSQDSIISSVIETYAEDAVQTNEAGQVVWAESSDANVSKYVNYLLNVMNADKHIYSWAHSIIKYGDLYLRLYRESDYENNELFNPNDINMVSNVLNENYTKDLNEDVNVVAHDKNDHYVHYVEAVSNPGEMFELTKFGKCQGYIHAPYNVMNMATENNFLNRYKLKKRDVTVYQATDFVHAALEDTSSRTPEEVQIFLGEDENSSDLKYKVRRGQSLLYNVFKIWRELSLLENSVLLNRLTKSSIVRMIMVEVGDMPKEQIGAHLQSIKALIEQKSAINTGKSMSEYTNPGPIENNIYVPTHQGVGNITTQQVGGDVDVRSLADLSYYQDKMFGALRVPKQYFGVTDDAAGFNGGSSLSIISSRYGKAVKRIQHAICQALTDVINIFLIDKGLKSYVNRFTVRMTAPVTQEELDRRDNANNRIGMISDIMNNLTDIEDSVIKLKILKALMSTAISDQEVIMLIQEQIEKLEEENSDDKEEKPTDDNVESTEEADDSLDSSEELPPPDEMFADTDGEVDIEDDGTFEEALELDEDREENYLPSASELNVDLFSD